MRAPQNETRQRVGTQDGGNTAREKTFRTAVEIPRPLFRLEPGDGVFMIGSCFAAELGEQLARRGMPCLCNPYGAAYNPLSIKHQLRRIIRGEALDGTEEEFVEGEGRWHSLMAHTTLSSDTPKGVADNINAMTLRAREALRDARMLVVTFGTAWVYLRGNRVVVNCHKQPEKTFTRIRLTTEEITAAFESLCQELLEFNPGISLLYTVSPIRHTRDGMHGNAISKATLLLATDQLLNSSNSLKPTAEYFPAYEILTDELRDYRFYANDMAHPSETAREYILELFCEQRYSAAGREALREGLKRALRNEHRQIGAPNCA